MRSLWQHRKFGVGVEVSGSNEKTIPVKFYDGKTRRCQRNKLSRPLFSYTLAGEKPPVTIQHNEDLHDVIADINRRFSFLTVAERLFLILLRGIVWQRIDLQDYAHRALRNIGVRAAGALFLPGHDDARKDIATDIIVENVKGIRKDIQWIGRQTRQSLIKAIRKQQKTEVVLVRIGDRDGSDIQTDTPDKKGKSSGVTAGEILSFLSEQAEDRPPVTLRTDWRVCQVCGEGFHARANAKTCGKKCRQKLSYQRSKAKFRHLAGIDTGRREKKQ